MVGKQFCRRKRRQLSLTTVAALGSSQRDFPQTARKYPPIPLIVTIERQVHKSYFDCRI
jgi:hypothetical protein